MDTVTTFDELKASIGRTFKTSEWVTIDQERINAFADATDDHQWIHVDLEKAAQSPFGGTIAHGMLTASVAGLLPTAETFIELEIPRKMTINYGFDKIRFPNPVPSGSRIRTIVELAAADEVSPGVIQVTNKMTVEIEGVAKPAMVAENLLRYYLED